MLKQLAKVKLGDDEVGDGSTLGVFDPGNPFNPPKGAIKKEEPGPSTAAGPSTGDTAALRVAAAAVAAATRPSDRRRGGIAGWHARHGWRTPPTTTTVYKYVVDLTFKANGHTRRIKGMEKLDMLPNQSAPLLIFMGVTPKGSNAVFLVDSTLEAAGEGTLQAERSRVRLRATSAPAPSTSSRRTDGDTYTVRIDEIRKVKVGRNSAATGAKARGSKARAAVGPNRRFVPPADRRRRRCGQ